MDSPKSKELDDKNTRLMMNFLKNNLTNNQIFVFTIFNEKDLFVEFDHIIKINSRAIENRISN